MEREDWDHRWLYEKRDFPTEPNVVLVREASALPPGRALDLGCGIGRNAVWLAGLGWEVTAVDFSRVALERARLLAGELGVNVAWIEDDLRRYEPPAGAFDLVLLLCIHLPRDERRGVLRRAATALAPGGTLLVVGHDLRNLTEGYRGPSNPEVLLTPGAVVEDLAGLLVERAGREARTIETREGATAKRIDTVVRARRAA
jgi:SAM-dependent methyltransferase